MSATTLFVSAGDPSGDNAAARVIAELKSRHPQLDVLGLGGSKLAALGQQQLADPDDLAVMGFWEVAKRFSFFRSLLERCTAEIRQRKPACVLLVDYPGFNLRLARRIADLDIPILYYISPQIWAWGQKRIEEIRELVDLMIIILPFEQSFFEDHGVRAEMVGHYLLEDIPDAYVASDPPGNGQIGLFPGSRRVEIERMLEPMLAAVGRYMSRHGGKAIVAGVRNKYDYETVIQASKAENVSVVYDDSRRVMYESDLIITASGTATLEAGIIARPMVIIYKTGFVTYQIARRVVKLDAIGLVNLVLGEKVVPELIQDRATPQKIANVLTRYHDDDAYRREVQQKLKKLPDVLGGKGASARAADLVEGYL